MNLLETFDVLASTMTEGVMIGFLLCGLRALLAQRPTGRNHVKSTAIFVVAFTTLAPYGFKLLDALRGETAALAGQGYTTSWLLTAMEGRLAGSAVGVALFLAVAAQFARWRAAAQR